MKVRGAYWPNAYTHSYLKTYLFHATNSVEKSMPFTKEETRQIGDKLGIDWSRTNFEEFRMGLDVELEHGSADSRTNVTNNDPILTGK